MIESSARSRRLCELSRRAQSRMSVIALRYDVCDPRPEPRVRLRTLILKLVPRCTRNSRNVHPGRVMYRKMCDTQPGPRCRPAAHRSRPGSKPAIRVEYANRCAAPGRATRPYAMPPALDFDPRLDSAPSTVSRPTQRGLAPGTARCRARHSAPAAATLSFACLASS